MTIQPYNKAKSLGRQKAPALPRSAFFAAGDIPRYAFNRSGMK